MVIATFVYLLCLGCWLGAIVFFSFFTAPVVFSRLPLAEAGKVVGAIFPLYYLLGYTADAIALGLAAYFAIHRAGRGWWNATTVLLAVALGLTLYAGLVVRPKASAMRTVVEQPNPDPARKAEFDALHRLAVQLNGGVLLLNLVALGGSAAALTRHG